MSRPLSRADRAVAWFVFGVFFALTLLSTVYVWRMSRASDRARFDNAVQATSDAIEGRMDAYVNVLDSTRALLIWDPLLPRAELRAYIEALDVQERYPGIQGVGLTVRVPWSDVRRLELEMRGSGHPNFRVWPDTPRPEIHSILVLVPEDRRNAAAIGYDMFTSPIRRSAMERARDTGQLSASGRVTLVQEIDVRKQAGFLIYAPLYSTGTPPKDVATRRAALTGFVYAPFRAADLFQGVLGRSSRPEIGFEVRDGNALLYRSSGIAADPRFTAEGAIRVADRTWTVRWYSEREGSGPAVMLAAGTFTGGMIIATLLFALIRVQLEARQNAEETAQQLRESELQLQAANRAKDDFLATLSHELRTPMTSIMGWSQILGGPDLDRETEAAAVDAIRKSAKVQAQLIDDLLDVSRITAGKMRIEHKVQEIGSCVVSAVETVRSAAEAKGITLAVSVGEGLWIDGDGRRIQQVVWNLLTNAVKFTPIGGEVRVEAHASGDDVVLEVRDTGQGIEPAFMPHLFERFRQADSSATRSHMGLGLGLAIVRHLVDMHGGTIEAESAGPGRGSLFRIRLPLVEPGEHAAAVIAERRRDLSGTAVLVVDDDEAVREYIATVLRTAGAEVRAADSARHAFDILQSAPVDIVLTDLGMPREDGFDLVRWIRSARDPRVRNVPVVAVTAFAMADDRQRVLDGGFQGFVAKPVGPHELRSAIAEALAGGAEAGAGRD